MKKRIIPSVSLIIALITVIMTFSVSSANLPFKDVKAKDWYYEAIDKAYTLGLIKGRSDTEFAPKGTMTRAELVTLMSRIIDEDISSYGEYGISFNDVSKKAWYANAVGWAYYRGIVTGYDGNVFKPDNEVSRQELAVIIARLMNYGNIILGDDAALSKFSDDGKIASWSRDFVDEMRLCGLVKGDNDNNFNPKASVTRAEVATIVVRLHEKSSEDPMFGIIDHIDEICDYEKNRVNVRLGFGETFTIENLNKILLRDCAGLDIGKYTLIINLSDSYGKYDALGDGNALSVRLPVKIRNLSTGKETHEKTYPFYFIKDYTFKPEEKDSITFDYKLKKDNTAEIVKYTGNGNVRELTIPKKLGGYTVTSIGDGAFYSERELEKIIIPDTVTVIGQRAFALCTSLREVKIPESVTKIKRAAFYYCTSLTDINLPENMTSISDYLFHMCSSLRFIDIPENVREIGAFAFNCTSLEVLNLPKNIDRIDDYSFEGCALKSVYIPDSCTYIGGWAFYNCEKLTDFSFGNGVKKLGSAIVYNTAVKEVKFRGTYAEFTKIEQVSSIESDKLLVPTSK